MIIPENWHPEYKIEIKRKIKSSFNRCDQSSVNARDFLDHQQMESTGNPTSRLDPHTQ